MRAVVYTADVNQYDDCWPMIAQDSWALSYRVPLEQQWPATGPPVQGISSQVRSRWLKWNPAAVLERFDGWEWAIWVDACVEVTSPRFVDTLVETAGDVDFVACRHPLGHHLLQEVEAVEALPSCQEHSWHRRELQRELDRPGILPEVVALGVFAVQRHAALKINEVWQRGVNASTVCVRDQLIFPFVARDLRLEVAVFDPPGGDFWKNDLWVRHPHREVV